MTIRFKNWDCVARISHYIHNKQPSIVLEDANTGERIAVATVCLADHNFSSSETAIKDYSENKGMLKALESTGIVKATGEFVKTGYTEVPIVTIVKK